MKLVFATNNEHKVKEIKAVVPTSITIITLKEAGINIDIPEPHNTLEANAFEKVRTIHQLTQTNCFGEDTGLEVTALNGEPGVFSARYSGQESTSEKNIAKLLNKLTQQHNRSAQFRTVVALILNNQEHYFEGICKGFITTAPAGSGGFGYDAIFVPEGATKTFAQMSLDEKNQYSHRRKAVDKLVTFLNNSVIN